MYSLRAAVHYSPDAVSLGCFENIAGAIDLDIPVHLVGLEDVAKGGSQMIDHLAPGDTLTDFLGVCH